MNAKKIPLAILGSAAGFFAVTFTIYFFNLDMKFLSRFVEPILLRHYDKIPANSTCKDCRNRAPQPRRAHFTRCRGNICAVH